MEASSSFILKSPNSVAVVTFFIALLLGYLLKLSHVSVDSPNDRISCELLVFSIGSRLREPNPLLSVSSRVWLYSREKVHRRRSNGLSASVFRKSAQVIYENVDAIGWPMTRGRKKGMGEPEKPRKIQGNRKRFGL